MSCFGVAVNLRLNLGDTDFTLWNKSWTADVDGLFLDRLWLHYELKNSYVADWVL